jgi:hypothetical protein
VTGTTFGEVGSFSLDYSQSVRLTLSGILLVGWKRGKGKDLATQLVTEGYEYTLTWQEYF